MANSRERSYFRALVQGGLSNERAKAVVIKAREQGLLGVDKATSQDTPLPTIAKEPKVESPSFIDKISTSTTTRGGNILDSIQRGVKAQKDFQKQDKEDPVNPFSFEAVKRAATKSIRPLQTAVETVGQLAGGVGDIAADVITSGASAITPDFIEDPVKQAVSDSFKALGETSVGKSGLQALQEGAEAFQEFKKENPKTARVIESIANIASIAPAGRLGKPLTSTVGEGAEKLGTFIKTKGDIQTTKKVEGKLEDIIGAADTKKQRIQQIRGGRVEEGSGFFGKGKVELTSKEKSALKEALEIEGVQVSDTPLVISNKVDAQIDTFHKQLTKELLDSNDLVDETALINKLASIKEDLSKNIFLSADAEKSAEKMMNLLLDVLTKDKAIGNLNTGDLIRIREQFDAIVKAQKNNIFEGNDSAIQIALLEIRRGLNEVAADFSPNVKVKKLLNRQTNLYTAKIPIAIAADKIARSKFGRMIQKLEKITKNKAGFLLGAGVVGVPQLAALEALGPLLAAGLTIGVAGKIVLSASAKTGIGKALQQVGTLLRKTPGNPELQILKDELEDLLLEDNEEENKIN